MIGIAAELQDVVLRDPQMFEHHPGGVGKLGGLFSTERGREVFHSIVEGSVGVSAVEQVEKMLAQSVVVAGWFL